MKARTAAICTVLVALLPVGCSATSRHKALTMFFDGVPPPKTEGALEGTQATSQAVSPSRPAKSSEHGPYAAKLCSACHDAAAINGLVLPKDQICFRCHALKLDKTFVHGPIASGGCLVCHDPHSSRYRYLLVSDSDSFCVRCHDPRTIAKIEGHSDLTTSCTTCHDAHQSDKKYLLK
jgi:predicted CXXCH cytochrome family protein